MKKTFSEYLSKSAFLFGGILVFMIGSTGLQAQSAFHKAYNRYLIGDLTAIETIKHQIEYLSHSHSHSHADSDFTKCLTPLFMLMSREGDNIDEHILQKFNVISSTRSSSAAEYISPSGKFRFHYDTAGNDRVPSDDFNNNSIPDYVEEAAEAADSSYRHEILTLGFTDPIGPGEVYDVFIEDLSNFGAYGLTNNSTTGLFPCNNSGPGTCIYIENDFVGYPPNTDPEGDVIGAIKVTMAHEFKHAIQYAQTNWSGESEQWVEMDATLMEEVVYDDVNDYYNYIEGFATDLFSSATTTLIPGSYEDITWALFFDEKFGPLFWTNVWDVLEENPSKNFLAAVEEYLESIDESYDRNLLESYMWHFASGSEYSGNNFGFEERLNYPEPRLNATYLEPLAALTSQFTLNRTSARYYAMEPIDSPEGFVALNYITSSSEIQFGLIGYQNDGNIITRTIISPADNVLTSIDTDWEWSQLERVGLVITNSSTINQHTFQFQIFEKIPSNSEPRIDFLNTGIALNSMFRIYAPSAQDISLEVYDVLGRHVQTVYNGRVESGFRDFNFDTSTLASGIYLYRLVSENSVQAFTFPVIK